MNTNNHNAINNFKDFAIDAGIELPSDLIADGQLHRFKINGEKSGKLSGAYVLHLDDKPAGYVQDFRTDTKLTWSYNDPNYTPVQLTPEQREQQAKSIRQNKELTAQAEAEKHAVAAKKAAFIWDKSTPITDNQSHPYLIKKGIKGAYSIRANDYKGNTSLVIGVGSGGAFSTLQFINADGSKRFLPDGKKKGCYSILNKTQHPRLIAIGEGFATVASIIEDPYCVKMGVMGVMALDAGNLELVAAEMRKQHPAADILIFGDMGDLDDKGEKAARAAAKAINGYCVLPPIAKGDFNDYLTSGEMNTTLEDLIILSTGSYSAPTNDDYLNNCPDFPTFESATERNKAQQNDLLRWSSGDDLADNAKAPDFLINDILETDSHGVLLGASMAYKSFLALELAHCICTGSAFFEHEAFTTGKVLYICGEGRGALERRIKALKIVKGGFNNNLMVLDTPINIDGSVNMASLNELINAHTPHLVIFDTFASLNNGTNENDPSEVARVLRLVKETCRNGKTSSLIVHHLGKDESRGGRGASNFKTDVDFSFEMKRTPDTTTATLSCVKMKDGDDFADIYINAHIVELGLTRQDGKATTSLVLKSSEYAPTEKNSKPLDVVSKNILTALHEAIEKNGIAPPNEIKARFSDSPQNCPVKVVHIDDLRPFAYPFLNVAGNSKRVVLKRCIEKLEMHGNAMFFNDYMWIAH